jgi:hypothetical protein
VDVAVGVGQERAEFLGARVGGVGLVKVALDEVDEGPGR